jgi:adenine-specific DNA-methyltransferase
MPRSRGTGGKPPKRPIEQYEHKNKQRMNNPPAGLVTAETDPPLPTHKTYDYVTPVPSVPSVGRTRPERESKGPSPATGPENQNPRTRVSAPHGLDYDPHLDPQLVWAGKKEHTSFDVHTVSLHVHERIDPSTIIEAVRRRNGNGHAEQPSLFERREENPPLHDAVDFYRHPHGWSNRLIAGDSLLVMNSLLEKEGMAGQVQMVYIDPPYGKTYNSNFQPFVNKRDVKDGKDEDLTQEPEMIRAFRDTWELGIHSYLTYLRDRLLLAKDLLHESGSCFVQISDDNLHVVRDILDEVFGRKHSCGVISFAKTSGFSGTLLSSTADYLLWYAKDRQRIKYRQLFVAKTPESKEAEEYTRVEADHGSRRSLTADERQSRSTVLASGGRLYRQDNIISSGYSEVGSAPFEFSGEKYTPGVNSHWKTTSEGLKRLVTARRIEKRGSQIAYVRFLDDFPAAPIVNLWDDTAMSSRAEQKQYVVQTSGKVIQRCLLMTTDPGDLVLDPTCGSGTTAYVAEQWGRRWITIDTSRVPLALARQRILTATYPWYELKDDARGPAGGFVYKRKQNNRGEEVGGIVPHITLKSIANDEPPKEEVLVDRPEIDNGITRVSGPFVVEATIPTPVDYEGDGVEDSGAVTAESYDSFVDRMLDVLRRNPKLQLGGGRVVELRNVRPPAKSMSIAAEAIVDSGALPGATLSDVIDEAEEKRGDRLALSSKPVAIAFGPENGAVSEKLVYNAGKEANARNYSHLFVIGFAIQPNAREMIENAESVIGIPATYVAATPDILMGDLLKTMRSSQIFSVCGLPEIRIAKAKKSDKSDPDRYTVTLLGLDTFDPVSMDSTSLEGKEVPAWLLDTDYNELCFHVTQAFFPGTGAWENLKRALRAEYAESVWDHLNGTDSAPFEASSETKIAVKVIDKRGNELMVVKTIGEAISKG